MRQASEEEWAAALGVLFADSEDRVRQSETALVELQTRDPSSAGLIVLERDRQVAGACWCQALGGGMGALWLPRFLGSGVRAEQRALMEAAEEVVARQGLCVVQSVPGDDGETDEELLVEFEFRYASELVLMTSGVGQFPTEAPSSPLEFKEYRASEEERLAELIERTYQDTLDFPVLNGVREVSDVLSGYRVIGVHKETLWFFVMHAGVDVGCLLLSDHPQAEKYELVYVGVVPKRRCQGWGSDIVRFAQWVARRDLRSHLALAVDAANAPALAIYRAAGFDAVGRRRVFLRIPR